jgi:hypothetical protein
MPAVLTGFSWMFSAPLGKYRDKVKVIPALDHVIKYFANKAYGGVEALDGGEWSASSPGRFPPGIEHQTPIA